MTRRGFTILEVLVAISLVIALLGAMFAFLFNLLDARRRTRESLDQQQTAQVFLQGLEHDLFSAIAGSRDLGAGVLGDADSLRIVTRGVPVSLAGADSRAAFSDVTAALYAFDVASGQLTGSRHVQDGRAGSGAPDVIGALGAVRFRYHDGRAWRDAFDSQELGRLPVAVEVSLWFADPDAPAALDDIDRFDGQDDVPLDERAPPDRQRIISIPDAAAEVRR